ncbi:hypothetical protein I7I51_07347 [Histoplasma capsulatum]|uniref:Uncharacterized protein n=1 Tax=Ajellomyces capsulatus TaxID=5037 RepID=A0A8A1MMS3_AJECA|nr:hypothetical protein I7I51_07347 [Histoplasma capsulatum]
MTFSTYAVLAANTAPPYACHNQEKRKHLDRKVHAKLHFTAAMAKFKPTLPTVPELPGPEISPLDHQLLVNGKTSSRIERLQSRLQSTKNRSSSIYVDDQILELTFENSYLRGEISRYEDYQRALLDLKYVFSYALVTMEEALSATTQRLRDADQNYLKLNGIEGLMEDGCEI